MMRCHECQALLLDLRYGLLDAAEGAAVEAHLAGCSDCTAAYKDVERAQGLISQAAKSEFPQVSFTPPIEEPAVPFVKRRPARSNWVQWAVAASVLALIPGTLLPLNELADRYNSAKRETDDAAVRMADAKTAYERGRSDATADARLAAAQQQHLSVVSAWLNDAKSEAARKVSVNVTKPAAAQPGAPNDFVVAIADPGETLKGGRVEAQFRDQDGKVLHTQAVDPKTNTPVRLPAEVWARATPQSELFLSVATVNAAGARTELQEPIRLFGPVYATMLVTDKATYRPGEHLYFRSLTLDRITLRPPAREQNLHFTLRKADGSGKTFELTGSTNLVQDANGNLTPLTDREGKPIRGVGCGTFVLPTDLADGEYILTLTELPGTGGAPPVTAFPATRSVQVRAGAPERFRKEITFDKESFAPGTPVTAFAELKLGDKPVVGATGRVTVTWDNPSIPANIRVEPQAKNGQNNYIGWTGLTDEKGRFKILFSLDPQAVTRGDVKVMVTFKHDGVEESVAKRVPVAGKDTTIEFFPEGGKLLAGVPNRVYVRGTDSTGTPIDVRGTIALADGKEIVAKVDAPGANEEPGVHRGTGSFTFTPKAGVKYTLRLQNGAVPGAAFELPPAETDGVAFTALDTVVKPGQPIRVRIHSVGKDRKLVVGAYTRGRLADKQSVMVKADSPAVVTLLAQADSRGGVTRITVFEEPADKNGDLIPVAERLVFRKPGEALNLRANASVKDGAVDLSIAATDEKGNPIPAILWAAAVNSAAAPGTKDRALPTHFLLAGEVQTPDDLEHADFLLTDHAKAAEALDHVLATQGWRRFVEQKPALVAGSPAETLAKVNGKVSTRANRDSLAEKYWPQFESTAKDVDAARKQKEAAEPAMLKLYAEYESSRLTTADLAAVVKSAAKPYDEIRARIPIAVGCVSVLTLMLGLLALARGTGRWGAAPYFLSAVAAGGLAAYLWIDSSRNPTMTPADVPPAMAMPSIGGAAKLPDVTLPPAPNYPYEVDSITEKSKIFSISVHKLIGSSGSTRRGMNPSIPAYLIDPNAPKPSIRVPLGWTVVDALMAAEQKTKEKSQAFADERALGTLRRIEAALLGTDKAADDAAGHLRAATPRTPPLVVREYAAPRPGAVGIHPDADTVLWQPIIVLPTDGKTTLHFNLGEAPGGYQVIVAGHTPDGRLGSVRTMIPVR